jgi:hypothetical protein
VGGQQDGDELVGGARLVLVIVVTADRADQAGRRSGPSVGSARRQGG